MAVAHAVKARVLTRAHQIAHRLDLGAGHMDRLEQSTAMKTRKLARVARVGLEALAGAARHQARRYHLAGDAELAQMPVKPEAGRPGLVAAARAGPARERPPNGLVVVGERALLEQLVGAHGSEPDRVLVDVQPDGYRRGRRVMHGRRPPYVALPGPPRHPTTMRRRRPLSLQTGRRPAMGGSILSKRQAGPQDEDRRRLETLLRRAPEL